MSGRKQHYIPQSLLRGFAKPGKGKALQVTVYSREHGVFTTATDGVAARRYFYSELSEMVGVETLDDRITAFENQLGAALAEFRRIAPGHAIDVAKAAEVVTHLCARQAHLRDSFASAFGPLIDGVEALFHEKEWMRKEMGLNESGPNEIFKDAIDKAYKQYETQLSSAGITRSEFEHYLFHWTRTNFDSNFPTLLSFLRAALGQLHGQTDKVARDGHIKALERSLVPDNRIEVLKQLAWRIKPRSNSDCVLPECLAVTWSLRAGYQPLMYAGKDLDAVFMPVCHNRLLVGERVGVTAPDVANEVLVACSWDFFVARDRTPEVEGLVPRIGERARKLIDEAVGAAIKK
jgi:hypothetical protein